MMGRMNPARDTDPLGLLNDVQYELAPPGEPKTGVAPCSPYKRRWRCGSVCGYHASKRSHCPLWI